MKYFKRLRLWFSLPGRVVYDPKTNQLLQVKDCGWRSAYCSGFTEYYSSAKTYIARQRLSMDYFTDCTIINCVDKSPYLELYRPVMAWRVKK